MKRFYMNIATNDNPPHIFKFKIFLFPQSFHSFVLSLYIQAIVTQI